MDKQLVSELIRKTYINHEGISSFKEKYPDLDMGTAYEIQFINRDIFLENDTISGYKVALSSKALQDKLNVNTPAFGHLYASKLLNDNLVSTKNLSYPKIEAEIAFVFKDSLITKNATTKEIINAVDYVCAAFEIADSRIIDWQFKIEDLIIDNSAFGYYYLGEKKLKLNEIDLVNTKVSIYINNELSSEGTGKNCLDSPINSLIWLVSTLANFDININKGDVILSGALSGATSIKKDDNIKAIFSDFGEIILNVN